MPSANHQSKPKISGLLSPFDFPAFDPYSALRVRWAGNEKWNDPYESTIHCWFPFRGSARFIRNTRKRSFTNYLSHQQRSQGHKRSACYFQVLWGILLSLFCLALGFVLQVTLDGCDFHFAAPQKTLKKKLRFCPKLPNKYPPVQKTTSLFLRECWVSC